MLFRSRSLIAALLSVSYVVAAGMRVARSPELGIFLLLAALPALSLIWKITEPLAKGEDWVSPETRTALRAVSFGGALLAAARMAPPGDLPFEAVALLGTTVACVSALVAMSRIAPMGGLFELPRRAKRPVFAAVVAVAGFVGVALVLSHAGPASGPKVDPEVIASGTCGVFLLGLVATSRLLLRSRRFDLGASERLTAALTLSLVTVAVFVPASLLGIVSPSHVLSAGAWIAAFVATLSCFARDPALVARVQRLLLAVILPAAPIGLFAVTIAWDAPRRAPAVVLAVLGLGIAVGLLANRIARALLPERSRWVEAIDLASAVEPRTDPDTAVCAILSALGRALGAAAPSPELWVLDPPTMISVDRAGYPRREEDKAILPDVVELAQAEPEQTLRANVLEALEVRRPDIRPALEWMNERAALAIVVVADTDGPLGALVLPRVLRNEPLILEEVRALRRLADRLAALSSVSAALSRARAREVSAKQKADHEEDRALYLDHVLASSRKLYESYARNLARGALLAPYSPAARLCIDELERLGQLGSPVTLLAPPGIDPVPYAAVVHAASPHNSGPFVVIDAAGYEEQTEDVWNDRERSPLCLADGGTLVILSVSALSFGAQAVLAHALADRKSPSGRAEPLDVLLVVSVPATVDVLVATERLTPLLADRLGDRSVPLPALGSRAEDLRAILVDRLARLGVRMRGRPMGLDPRALARLVEHAWPGNDVELEDVLTRAIAIADGEVLTAQHLEQIGFVASPPALRRGSRPPGAHSLRS